MVKFRALTVKNSGREFNEVWVEGDLIHSKGKTYIHPISNAVTVKGEIGRLIIMHEVNPETVRQVKTRRMKLIEVTPEKETWITQKVLYAYDTDRIATLFVICDDEMKAVYGYQFLDRGIQELDDDNINSWEDAEKVFLEIIADLLGDEERYYNDLKYMCEELKLN